jgi:hypothetical protein
MAFFSRLLHILNHSYGPTTPDLLQEFEDAVDLVPVSPGLRFVNYLIDLIAFYAVSFIVGMIGLL